MQRQETRRLERMPLEGPAGNLRLDKVLKAWQLVHMSLGKLEELRALIRSYGSCLVAYSGGVDSVFLARVAKDVLGPRSLAAIADSPSLPRRELREALEIAQRFEIPVRVIQTKEFDNPEYLANPDNRCYFCKRELFAELEPLARSEGFAVIAYGENASDAGDDRPGGLAAREFQVRAPLKELGFTKAEIRDLSAWLGLPTAGKPQMACLSSRIPHGETVTPEKLRMIEEAEYVLRDLGFHDVRVRHHEWRSAEPGARKEPDRVRSGSDADSRTPKAEHPIRLARIELGAAEMPRLFQGDTFLKVGDALKKVGYAHVTLDLQGYRRGSASHATIALRTGS